MTLYRCYRCGGGFMARSTYEGGARLCDNCMNLLRQLEHAPLSPSADISRAGVDVRGSKEKEAPLAKVLVCFRCGKEPEKRLLNGEYWCPRCRKNFSAEEARAYLIARMKEAENRMLQKACVTCGKQLSDPNWCSWCGSKPAPGESIIGNIIERLRATDTIIAAGDPLSFKKAISGDKQAIASIFKEALAWEPTWRSLIQLGSAAVDFLIGELRSECKDDVVLSNAGGGWTCINVEEYKMRAVKALGEIGDVRAVEPLMEAINSYRHPVFKALDTIGLPPRSFGPLLIKLRQRYPLGSFPIRLEDTATVWIFSSLSKLIDHAAAEIPASDLSAAAQMDDVPVDTLKHSHEGPHYLHESDLTVVHEMLDCSALRQAAQRELRRRGLV